MGRTYGTYGPHATAWHAPLGLWPWCWPPYSGLLATNTVGMWPNGLRYGPMAQPYVRYWLDTKP